MDPTRSQEDRRERPSLSNGQLAISHLCGIWLSYHASCSLRPLEHPILKGKKWRRRGIPKSVRGQIQKRLSCQVYNRKRNACLRTPPTCFLKREKWTSPQTIGIEKKKYAIRSLGLIHLHLWARGWCPLLDIHQIQKGLTWPGLLNKIIIYQSIRPPGFMARVW